MEKKVLLIIQVCFICLSSGFEPKWITDKDVIDDYFPDSSEFSLEETEEDSDVNSPQPYYDQGLWKCGECDVINKSKLIYSELYEVEKNNIDKEYPVVLQVALAMDAMKCITLTASKSVSITRKAGNCTGDSVSFSVNGTENFTVNVYS